ncbi:G-protein coupled receptor 84-like [Littorina saxatilis]|uniref:G-protein coupled receptors family 1 profile domain-containing protein n=1 Tax=Littorina saxatilis TaxID=31220 RepID=A0AAN9GKJ7_9CAEN
MLNQTEFIGTPFNQSLHIVLVAIGIAVLLSGILGNGLLLAVMWRSRRDVRGVSNIFIANLALADLVVVCCGVPFVVVDLLWNRHPVAGTLHCQLNGFVLSVGYSVSVLSMTLISFNRYAKVCHSNVFHRLFSPRRNKIFCLLLWATGIVLNLPFFLPAVPSYGYDPGSHICNARAGRKYAGYGTVAMMLMLILPVFLIGYFNAAIFRRWRDTRRQLQRHKGKERRKVQGKEKGCTSVSVEVLPNERNNTAKEESTEVDKDVGPPVERVAGKLNSDMTSSIVSVTTVSDDVEGKNNQPDLTSYVDKLGSQTSSEKPQKSGKKVLRWPFRFRTLLPNAAPHTRVQTPVTSRLDEDLSTGGVSSRCVHNLDDTDTSADADTRTQRETTDADDLTVDKGKDMRRHIETNLSEDCCGSARETAKKKSSHVRARRMGTATDRKQTVSEMALVRSLLVVFICFFVLYTPFAVTLILTVLLKEAVPPELPVTSTLCLFVNCAINWIIYGVMNTVFRHAYVSTIKNLRYCCCVTCTFTKACAATSRGNVDA